MKPFFLLVAALLLGIPSCGIDYAPSDSPQGGDSGVGGEAGNPGTGGVSSTVADRTCERASDCVVIPETCCGTCGVASTSDMVAVRAGEEPVHRAAACAENDACPACAGAPDPNLFAVCEAGLCEARDVRTSDASTCERDEDCEVLPRACCVCGASDAPGTLVSVRVGFTAFTESLCEADAGCPECGWQPPEGVRALCYARRCSVIDSRL